jgi:hypothetical protein
MNRDPQFGFYRRRRFVVGAEATVATVGAALKIRDRLTRCPTQADCVADAAVIHRFAIGWDVFNKLGDLPRPFARALFLN